MNLDKSKILDLGWIDYLLSGTAAGLATVSAGLGLGVPEVGLFFANAIAVGTIAGALLKRLFGRNIPTIAGVLYTVFAFGSLFFTDPLNNLLPSDGFPPQLRSAGWLCWVLVFGTLFMWSDSTILFQAVPGIAVFGLVGTWDTFRPSPFLFFAFLLLFATLFARAHARGMMLRASESGYHPNLIGPLTFASFFRALKTGPWRWVAGPEWALGSALAVVLISLVSAPIFQLTFQPISGFVRMPLPPTPAMRRNYYGNAFRTPATTDYTGARYTVGNGPHAPIPQDTLLFKVKFASPAYLKYRTYNDYHDGGWSSEDNGNVSIKDPDFLLTINGAKRYHLLPFELQYQQGAYDSIPVPGILDALENVPRQDYREDDTVVNGGNILATMKTMYGRVKVPYPLQTWVAPKAGEFDAAQFDTRFATPSVASRAVELTRKAPNDYQKAVILRDFISKQVTYDLNAPPTPDGKDPVDYCLFTSKRGYCDLFASCMVIMARSAGLPARYVLGYAPFTDGKPDRDGFYSYYATDYHAWAEVYFKNYGWMIFDPSVGARQAPGAGLTAATLTSPWYQQPTVIWSALVVLGVLLIFFIRLGVRRLPNLMARMNKNPRDVLGREYGELVRILEKQTGKPRRPSQTPFEYLDTVRPYLNGTTEAVETATGEFVRVYYSSAEPEEERVTDAKALLQRAKEAVRAMKPVKETRSRGKKK